MYHIACVAFDIQGDSHCLQFREPSLSAGGRLHFLQDHWTAVSGISCFVIGDYVDYRILLAQGMILPRSTIRAFVHDTQEYHLTMLI